jgi:hypothetical protein
MLISSQIDQNVFVHGELPTKVWRTDMENTKEISIFLFAAAFLLVLGFAIRLGADYFQYVEGLKTHPFYFYILERGATFLAPAVLCTIGGRKLRPTHVKKDKK